MKVVKLNRGQKMCPDCKRVCGSAVAKCKCGHVFNRKRKTLWAIFDEVGNQTSIPEVQKRYKRVVGCALAESEVSRLRKEWTEQQEKLLPHDCRTLTGQPRRNMMRDDKVGQSVFDRLVNYLDTYGLEAQDFVQTVRSFHSIPQLIQAVQTAAALRKIVKAAA